MQKKVCPIKNVELSNEQKKRQSLRQMGISEDFVTEIVGLLIRAMFYGIKGEIGRIKLGLLCEQSKAATFTMQL